MHILKFLENKKWLELIQGIALFQEPKKLAAMLTVVLSGLLCLWQFILLFKFKIIQPNQMPLQLPTVRLQCSLRDDSLLFRIPLFGNYLPNNAAEVKQSRLDLTLVGIMLATKANQSQVIIRTANGLDKVYLIEDSLPGGAIIKRITNNGIVILYKGGLESLSLIKNELTFDASAKPLSVNSG